MNMRKVWAHLYIFVFEIAHKRIQLSNYYEEILSLIFDLFFLIMTLHLIISWVFAVILLYGVLMSHQLLFKWAQKTANIQP